MGKASHVLIYNTPGKTVTWDKGGRESGPMKPLHVRAPGLGAQESGRTKKSLGNRVLSRRTVQRTCPLASHPTHVHWELQWLLENWEGIKDGGGKHEEAVTPSFHELRTHN